MSTATVLATPARQCPVCGDPTTFLRGVCADCRPYDRAADLASSAALCLGACADCGEPRAFRDVSPTELEPGCDDDGRCFHCRAYAAETAEDEECFGVHRDGSGDWVDCDGRLI